MSLSESRHFELVVPEGEPERLDRFVAAAEESLTRSAVQRLIEEGRVLVNGIPGKASQKVVAGERVEVEVPPAAPAVPVAEQIPLEILYEDADVVVVNKEAGMTVHQGAGNFTGTLVNALLGHCGDLSGIGGEIRPGIVHRLDKDTSGVLVVAKNDRSHQELARQFADRRVKRLYLALVYGSPRMDSGRVESEIARHPTDRTRMTGKGVRGKKGVTNWKVLERFGETSLLQLRLETGRTHQIRVHMSESGHPLVGDDVYGAAGRLANIRDAALRKELGSLKRQALHARVLGFIHPGSGEFMEFDTPLPQDMEALISFLRQRANGEKPCR